MRLDETTRLRLVDHITALGIEPETVLLDNANAFGYYKILGDRSPDGWRPIEWVDWTQEQLDYIEDNYEIFLPWLYPTIPDPDEEKNTVDAEIEE